MTREPKLATEKARKISESLKKRFADPRNHPCYGEQNPSARKLPHLFKKGGIPWIKGRKQTPEHIRKKAESCRKHKKWSLGNFDDGFVWVDSRGNKRMRVWLPEHPRSDTKNKGGKGYVLRSIVAYEAYHGVVVEKGEIIHHVDGDTLNDSKENLQKLTVRQHNLVHKTGAHDRRGEGGRYSVEKHGV